MQNMKTKGFNDEEQQVLSYLVDKHEIIRQDEFLPFSMFRAKDKEYELMYQCIRDYIFNGVKTVYGDWMATNMGFESMLMQFMRTYNGDNIHYNIKLKKEDKSGFYDKLYAYSPDATTLWHVVNAYKLASEAGIIKSKGTDEKSLLLALDAVIANDYKPIIEKEVNTTIKKCI